MDLFDLTDNKRLSAPLAERMRPQTLQEFIGQPHLIGGGTLLERAIKADRLGSCIFYGPPGVGKTTLAVIIANATLGAYVRLNAVSSGVADAKKVIDEARDRQKMYGKRTYLLLDECHRWNKAQSDCVLAAIEEGSIIFIGTTTENPNMAMTKAIVSRCRVFELKALREADLVGGIDRALKDKQNGLGGYNIEMDVDAKSFLAWSAAGDLRNAFNGLELAVLSTPPDADGVIRITKKVVEQSVQGRSFAISESTFFDMLSAFCKSLRGSDPDAALYWAFALLEAGCDPLILFRRMICHASEDVGMADSSVLQFVVAAMDAYKNIGMPEGELLLAHAVIYIASAPKSNKVLCAKERAKEAVREIGDIFVPLHLRNNNNSTFDKSQTPYQYPHDFGGYVSQQYKPSSITKQFYTPTDNGAEKEIRRRLENFKAATHPTTRNEHNKGE